MRTAFFLGFAPPPFFLGPPAFSSLIFSSPCHHSLGFTLEALLCVHPLRAHTHHTEVSADTASSRPGILVLINDADWELEGEEAYEIKSGDNILFVSTLHGG